MVDNYLIFKGLFEIWKSRNYDLYFYFKEIFDKGLDALSKRTIEDGIQIEEGGIPRYKALFVPVGFSIENVALISALFKPDYLRLAFTEGSKSFHNKHIHLVKENIRNVQPNIKITEALIISDDQKYTEGKILEWVEEMKTGYGLSYGQMAIDLTGGTKPMSIGAYNAAISFDHIDAFYLRTEYDEETEQPIPGTEALIPLKKEKSQVDRNIAFVIMPFAKEHDEIYQWIGEAITSSNMKCLRVDKEIFIGGIMDKVRENVIKAGVVIADLTESNLNVYYELGLSHGHSKRVIMLTQNVDNLPFDLKHLRMVIYDRSNKAQFINQLSQEIQYVRRD
jgi:hypothetical protein